MATKQLDITKEHCPMTFVKTKLALDGLAEGDVLEVLLTEGEPLDNVPKSCREQGFEILEISPVDGAIHKVRIKRRP